MTRARLTLRRLRAMEGAVGAMLAGAENEGDWPDGSTFADMEAARDWISDEIDRRERNLLSPKGTDRHD